jgi:molybdopterin-containing oxidoreductase family iron-sulfur binding subunit
VGRLIASGASGGNLVSDQEHTPEPAKGESAFSRRSFLKLAGFAFAGAVVGGCQRAPVQTALVPPVQPEDVIPGRALVYASTCGACNAGCGLLVKTRDGRPIKLEGDPSHPLSRGGLCAAGQASILGLYDRQRLQGPRKDQEPATWASVDAEVRNRIEDVRRQGRPVRFLTGTITSPTTRQAIANFLATFPDARHVVHDPLSCSAILEAHLRSHGLRALPRYRLEQAEVIVGFDADFLGTWIAPVPFAADYQAGRFLQGPAPAPGYHVQVESRLSLTGSKADRRLCVAPGEMGLVMTHLAVRVARRAGFDWGGGELAASPVPVSFLDDLVERLWRLRGRSLVLCGSQDLAQQLLCNFLNHLLDNYGATVDVAHPSYQNQSSDHDLEELRNEIRHGRVGALFVYRSNPLYDWPDGPALAEGLRAVPLLVSFAPRMDETAALARYVCPEPHYLESWSDAEPVDGVVSLYQPVLQRLGETRSVLESLGVWMGRPQPALDQLRESWQAQIYPRSLITVGFQEFWDHAVRDGAVRVRGRTASVRPFDMTVVAPVRQPGPSPEGSLTLLLYPKVGMPNGSHAYNPWLQELPDPLSKVTWDNYACVSPATAARLAVRQGDVVSLEGAGGLELPVVIQPGQHDQVVAVALGYGSRLSERFANIGPPWLEARSAVGADGRVGVNAAPLLAWHDGVLRYQRAGVRVVKTGRQHPLACTQDQPTLRLPLPLAPAEPRSIIRDTTLTAYLRSTAEAPPPPETRPDLWPDDHPIDGPRWGMAIDLSACTGCSACVIACQVENNIPVVGSDEVRRHREMHWLRIDRYYSSPAHSPVDGGPARASEVDVAHQPMLCQQCGNAPCEVVCPVLATVHSSEGLNQQVYNRCVGTRYCANNCPYKVRRFNWFDYAHDDQLQNLVLNPDVTVRSRGVMEKCTFCVQRIQEARIEARRLDRPVADGDIQTACQQSCPTKAIVFGNLNDPQSRAARLARSTRAYRVLEELNVQPAIHYLALVRNRPAAEERGEP